VVPLFFSYLAHGKADNKSRLMFQKSVINGVHSIVSLWFLEQIMTPLMFSIHPTSLDQNFLPCLKAEAKAHE
jgi:hypothetical protein